MANRTDNYTLIKPILNDPHKKLILYMYSTHNYLEVYPKKDKKTFNLIRKIKW